MSAQANNCDMLFLAGKKEKAIKLTKKKKKNFAHVTITQVSAQRVRDIQVMPPGTAFSTQRSHPFLAAEEASAACVRGERHSAKLPYLFMGLAY